METFVENDASRALGDDARQFPVTVNRVMGLCAFETIGRPDTVVDKVVVGERFHTQMHEIAKNYLVSIYNAIKAKAEKLAPTDFVPDQNDPDVTIYRDSGRAALQKLFPQVAKMTLGKQVKDPIVGLFQSQRFELTIGERKWEVRVRLSVTACLLEDEGRFSKLWVSFEGVPTDPSSFPTEADSVAFVAATTELAQTAIKPLREAYTKTYGLVTGNAPRKPILDKTQLRVSIADNTGRDFSELVDMMSLAEVPFFEAAAGDYGDDLAKGADDVSSFIDGVGSQPADFSPVQVWAENPTNAAIYTLQLPGEGPPEQVVIVGLASSSNLISSNLPTDDEWKRVRYAPAVLRSISAARPLSAVLADGGARLLDSLTRAHIQPPSP